MDQAVKHVRGGNGPAIVEVESYRWFGHSTADAGKYRTKEEVDSWKAKDPIVKYRQYLTKEGIATEEELDAIQAQVVKEIDDAYEYAQNSPDPELSVAFEDVWVD
ncbi:Pyruvate dehydrogenase E1 component alpha subunit [Streptococcus uberis]|nr:Pyruvate dehydrogenase E1 component alpha subunit [Streptococcus uberis]